ncbi:ribosome maturation factor RimP [Gephyromycinifex aptenodytis]|uniref:ribosome maturation factor RimP n=1 Tax=Gephyromycinifex aptenodytis TaxID=2716227 RepID=UPI001446C919|nr:ribosome maturation factor RimP [Gephyromycinifex aptenodytis]
MSDSADRIGKIAQTALADLPLRVEDVSITPAGKRRVVRISVDDDLRDLAPDDETTPVPYVDLDLVADATRAISDALDEANVLGATPYVLEVTSPGVSRPLTEPRHFRRNVGRLVRVRLTPEAPAPDGVQGRPTGRIVAVNDTVVRLSLPATKTTPEHEITLAHEHIASADVQVEFSRLEDEEDD